jgi:hypothetical protein
MKGYLLLAALVVVPLQAQKPDLGGVWVPLLVKDLGSNTNIPFQAWAKQKFQENQAVKQNDLDLRCLPPGVPRIMLTARPFEMVQTPNRILLMYEGGAHVWRQIWMDGREHPKDPNPDWLGHSIGHWEGDTLVVDSVGFNDRTWLDDAGHPHTEQLHVTEKYARTGPTTMKYDVVIDDPGAYTRSWTGSNSLSFRPGGKLEEDICLDKVSQ